MKLYHGSSVVVKEPQIFQSNRPLDFGYGFYLTTNKNQARKWAKMVAYRSGSNVGVVNEYNFDIDLAEKGLKVLKFNKADEKWLKFVCANRSGKLIYENYDIVIGPVADDKVYSVIIKFENGEYEIDEALKRLKTEQLCDQVLFHTERALKFLSFIEKEFVNE